MPKGQPVAIRVHLTSMPEGFDERLVVGLQVGKHGLLSGSVAGDGVVFEGSIDVRPGREGEPDFFGPLVHGPRGERFLYVCWGHQGANGSFRRLKLYLVPLKRAHWEQPGLTWADLQGGSVVVEVEGRGTDGTPACGTSPARWRSALS